MMKEVLYYYNRKIKRFTEHREDFSRWIHKIGTLRLFLFVTAVILIWLFRNMSWMVWLSTAVVFAIPFFLLMILHAKFFACKNDAEAHIRLNENELKGLAYDFSAFDGAPERMDAQHPYGLDLDLFGSQSLFQSINRTTTPAGRRCLIDWFEHPLTDKAAILRRQQAVRKMGENPYFNQCFYATGQSMQGIRDDVRQLEALAGRRTDFSKSRLWPVMTWVIPGLWLTVAAGHLWFGWPVATYAVMLAVSFLTANIQARRIHRFHRSADRMEQMLQTCSELMKLIEERRFKSEELLEMKQLLASPDGWASQAIKRLSKIIGALDQRFSMMGILLNMLCLRDMRQAMQLEKWLDTHAAHFSDWFKSLAQIDAMCSLGGFAFNHPGYVYPEIADAYFRMEGKALGHPLLQHCVRNDLQIAKHPCFLVITGANMAGKSTYLRTVGVNFLLARMGLPVCAESLTVYPAHLVTSLRTADSLAANESYFQAELKRLKMIIDRLNAGEELFIILDEVLKGTNSRDRQTGSLALLRQLIARQTCGLIATHDLSLGQLRKEFPDEVRNYRFEADITQDELTFTYRLHRGIAQNMNAGFLMRKMGIIP
jgi:hypothetical protein